MSAKFRPKHGWTYMTNLATSTNGQGLTVKAATHATSDLILKKQQAAQRRALYHRRK